jgi:hypothetical protein
LTDEHETIVGFIHALTPLLFNTAYCAHKSLS